MPSRRQIVGIDLVRFFAALYVTLYHLSYWVAAGAPDGRTFRAAGIPDLSLPQFEFFRHGSIGVPIFFVISGFVIAYSAENATAYSFLRSRLIRLVPTVWIIAPITFVFAAVVNLAPMGDLVKQLLKSLVFYPLGPWIDGVYWTLPIEICFYASIFGLLLVGRFNWIRVLAMTIGSGSTAFWIAASFGHFIFYQGNSIAQLLQLSLVHYGCFFALGVCLWLYFLKDGSFVTLALIFIFAGACLTKIAFGSPDPFLPCIVWSVAVVTLAAAPKLNHLFLCAHRTRLVARTAGLSSYPLYLLHDIVGAALFGWLFRAGLGPVFSVLWSVLAVVAGSVLIATILEPIAQCTLARFIDLFRFPRSQARELTPQ